MLTAITREISPALGSCALTHLQRTSIDIDRARRQHRQYQAALCEAGCKIISVPTQAELADSVFIEDTALVLDEIAVMCRPGAESRRPEVAGVKEVLGQFRPLAAIEAPGSLDGGDLLLLGRTIYAGLSTRSNHSGIGQLREAVADFGYAVTAVEISGCLHLKSAITRIAPGWALVNPDWVDKSGFSNCELIEIDPREAHAANALLIGQKLIYPAAFPRTLEKLTTAGIDVTTVDVSELQKAEGAVTCCSLILDLAGC